MGYPVKTAKKTGILPIFKAILEVFQHFWQVTFVKK